MDPVTDRLLVVSGVVVCWRFDLLPRWALAVLAARELVMLALGALRADARAGAAHQLARAAGGGAGDGRRSSSRSWACSTLAEVLLYVGLALALVATVMYARYGAEQVRARRGSALESPSQPPL